MQLPYSDEFLKKLHRLYTKTDLNLDQVGEQMGLRRRQINNIVRRMRGIDPEKWPKRYPIPDNRLIGKRRKRWNGPESSKKIKIRGN